MELLEREGPLRALARVRDDASEGSGSVVLLTGEPGIGKTALVTRFAEDHAGDARVLWGTCDNLSIPRPLGNEDLAMASWVAATYSRPRDYLPVVNRFP